ncbi:MAG: hypothetical protein ACI9U2_004824, partial [Bradymonadia bacterium]
MTRPGQSLGEGQLQLAEHSWVTPVDSGLKQTRGLG